jgi:hypothetical protein
MTEPNHSTSSKLANDIVALGRKHSKTAFPNPKREGCPNRSILRAVARRDRRLTLKDLPASHIVSCSPCFQEYTSLRRSYVLWRGIQISAASVALAVVVFIGARFLWSRLGRSGETVAPEKQIAGTFPHRAHRQPPASAPILLKVDLASFSPTRGDGNDDSSKKVHFPRKSLRVNFVLPFGMEPGEYEIRLQSSAGTVVFDNRASGQLNDGITSVQVDVDLGTTPPGSFILMIRPPGLDWRSFPAVVE